VVPPPARETEDDSIDVNEVARLLRLKHRTSVGTYRWRYPDFPKPLARGNRWHLGRWSRSKLLAWMKMKNFQARGKSATLKLGIRPGRE